MHSVCLGYRDFRVLLSVSAILLWVGQEKRLLLLRLPDIFREWVYVLLSYCVVTSAKRVRG